MKYFACKKHMWPVGQMDDARYGRVYEITSKYALELYKGLSKATQFNLVAVPNHKNGTRVDGKLFSVWGEKDSTNADCFKRRLAGTLENKILNKRMADE